MRRAHLEPHGVLGGLRSWKGEEEAGPGKTGLVRRTVRRYRLNEATENECVTTTQGHED